MKLITPLVSLYTTSAQTKENSLLETILFITTHPVAEAYLPKERNVPQLAHDTDPASSPAPAKKAHTQHDRKGGSMRSSHTQADESRIRLPIARSIRDKFAHDRDRRTGTG